MTAWRHPTLRQVLAHEQRKIIVFAVVLAGLTLMLSGFLVIRDYARRDLALVARTIGYTVEPAVVFGDREAIVKGIASVAQPDSVASVEVVDLDGRELARWGQPRSGVVAVIERSTAKLLWRGPEVRAVTFGDRKIATVRVYGSSQGTGFYLLTGVLVSLLCLAFTAVVTNLLARRLEQDVLGPLDRVGEVAHAVRTQRAFHRRVPVAGLAEIDKFVQDFNALLAELEGWHSDLTGENRELSHRALHDPLTGLGNRAGFERTVGAAIATTSGREAGFALLYLDADDFKPINDRHGHDAGDAVLRAIAERLAVALGVNEGLFRLGGDEFAILLNPCADRAGIASVVDRIRREMAGTIALPDGTATRISLSVGSAFYPDDGGEVAALLKSADRSMYDDKNRRKDHGPDIAAV